MLYIVGYCAQNKMRLKTGGYLFMQKLLLLLIISYLITSCNQQTKTPTLDKDKDDQDLIQTTRTKRKSKTILNTEAQKITKHLTIEENETLDFMIDILQDDTIAKNIEIHTDQKINDMIIYLGTPKIKEMVGNINQVLKAIKNAEIKIQEINDNNPHKTELKNRLEKEINKHKVIIKNAVNYKSFDITKDDTQNATIDIIGIINIQNEATQAIDAQTKENALNSDHKNALRYLRNALTENNAYTHKQFNCLISNLVLDEIKDMLTNIVMELTHKINAINYIAQINDTTQKTNLNNEIENIDKNFKDLLKIAFNYCIPSPHVAKQNIKKIPPNNFIAIKNKAKQAIDNQGSLFAITKLLDAQQKRALEFIIDILQNEKIYPYQKTYTSEETDNLIIYLGEQQISEMVENVVKALEEIEKAEINIQRINDNNPQKIQLNKQLNEEIKNYQQDIKEAANYMSYDLAKINIQNIPITYIVEIRRAAEVQNTIVDHITPYDEYAQNTFNYLKNAVAEQNNSRHDEFNQFILQIGPEKTKELIIPFAKKIKAIGYTKIYINHIRDRNKKDRLKTELENAHQVLKKSIRNIFQNNKPSFNNINHKLQAISFDRFKKIDEQALQIYRSQSG